MDIQRRSLQIGAAAVLCAAALRLITGSLPRRAARLLEQPAAAAFLAYLETGRIVRPEQTEPFPPESPPPDIPESTEPRRPQFTREQGTAVPLNSRLDTPVDLGALAESPLRWQLAGGQPTVLILHTHTSESYTREPDQDYRELSAYHTADDRFNMLRIGDAAAQKLEQAGIRVIHDRQFHDEPSYTGSYDHAKAAIDRCLAETPSVLLILDLHRDAADTESGQLRTEALVDGQPAAQLLLVVGTDAGGLAHPNWQENLSLAVKLQLTLEDLAPGITRPISLRKERFNQHERPGALLVEVGAAGNTLSEALRAADVLADAVIRLADGAN